jgi:hypothetical protein
LLIEKKLKQAIVIPTFQEAVNTLTPTAIFIHH